MIVRPVPLSELEPGNFFAEVPTQSERSGEEEETRGQVMIREFNIGIDRILEEGV